MAIPESDIQLIYNDIIQRLTNDGLYITSAQATVKWVGPSRVTVPISASPMQTSGAYSPLEDIILNLVKGITSYYSVSAIGVSAIGMSFSDPISAIGNMIGLKYNVDNLRLTNGQLNTIQDIGLSAIPSWSSINLTGVASGSFLMVSAGGRLVAVGLPGIDHGGLSGLADDDHPHYVHISPLDSNRNIIAANTTSVQQRSLLTLSNNLLESSSHIFQILNASDSSYPFAISANGNLRVYSLIRAVDQLILHAPNDITLRTSEGDTGTIYFQPEQVTVMQISNSGGYIFGSLNVTSAATFHSNVQISGERLQIGGTANNAVINSNFSMYFNIDSDNNSTSELFAWGTNSPSTGSTRLMTLAESGALTLPLEGIILNRSAGTPYIIFANGANTSCWTFRRDVADGALELHSNALLGTSGHFRIQNDLDSALASLTVDTVNNNVFVGNLLSVSGALNVTSAATFHRNIFVTSGGSIFTGRINRGIDSDTIFITPGNGVVGGNLGGNLTLYGHGHATQANDILFAAGSTTVLQWDQSESRWDLNGNLRFLNTTFRITAGTTDGSDNASIEIGAGGGISESRGAFIQMYGNENVGANLSGASFYYTGNISTGHHRFYTGNGLLRLRIAYDGHLYYDTTDFTIMASTSDGSDNNRLILAGGGGTSNSRGGAIALHGNEYAIDPGTVQIDAGDVAGALIILKMRDDQAKALSIREGSNDIIVADTTNGSELFSISYPTMIQSTLRVFGSVSATGSLTVNSLSGNVVKLATVGLTGAIGTTTEAASAYVTGVGYGQPPPGRLPGNVGGSFGGNRGSYGAYLPRWSTSASQRLENSFIFEDRELNNIVISGAEFLPWLGIGMYPSGVINTLSTVAGGANGSEVVYYNFSTSNDNNDLIFATVRGNHTGSISAANLGSHVTANWALGNIFGYGWNGSQFQPAGRISFVTDGTPTSGNITLPGRIEFAVGQGIGTGSVIALTLNKNGNARFANNISLSGTISGSSYSGSGTRFIAADSTGLFVATSLGPASINGTVGRIPRFTGTTVIEDSILSAHNDVVSISGTNAKFYFPGTGAPSIESDGSFTILSENSMTLRTATGDIIFTPHENRTLVLGSNREVSAHGQVGAFSLSGPHDRIVQVNSIGVMTATIPTSAIISLNGTGGEYYHARFRGSGQNQIGQSLMRDDYATGDPGRGVIMSTAGVGGISWLVVENTSTGDEQLALLVAKTFGTGTNTNPAMAASQYRMGENDDFWQAGTDYNTSAYWIAYDYIAGGVVPNKKLVINMAGDTFLTSACIVSGHGLFNKTFHVSGNVTFNGNFNLVNVNRTWSVSGYGTIGNSLSYVGPSQAAFDAGLNGYFYAGKTGANALVMDATGSDYGLIMNPSSTSWALGYGGAPGTLGTSVLTWTTGGEVSVAGAFGRAILVTTATSDLTLDSSHSTVVYTGTGAKTVTLPTAASSNRRIYTIVSKGSGSISLARSGSDKIYWDDTTGANSYDIAVGLTGGETCMGLTVQSDGSASWHVIGTILRQ